MKTVFYRWYEPDGYHKFTFENTKLWDDSPGNQFKICVYFEGELLLSTLIDTPKTINPRGEVEKIAIKLYENLRGINQ
ncbi:hypothetical protein QUB68_24375 [Microcoleus sp. A006_D1]|uniref:hypothetical protein n=1 Tax=Microcoleus sp. A006_D1 TaxID=3055267 RepID=UPI002FCF1051